MADRSENSKLVTFFYGLNGFKSIKKNCTILQCTKGLSYEVVKSPYHSQPYLVIEILSNSAVQRINHAEFSSFWPKDEQNPMLWTKHTIPNWRQDSVITIQVSLQITSINICQVNIAFWCSLH